MKLRHARSRMAASACAPHAFVGRSWSASTSPRRTIGCASRAKSSVMQPPQRSTQVCGHVGWPLGALHQRDKASAGAGVVSGCTVRVKPCVVKPAFDWGQADHSTTFEVQEIRCAHGTAVPHATTTMARGIPAAHEPAVLLHLEEAVPLSGAGTMRLCF